MMASLTGDRFLFEIRLDKIRATSRDDKIHPVKIPNSTKVKRPVAVLARNIAAPPPIPNKFGSPNVLRVESWIKAPASPSDDPVNTAVAILGILISQMTILEMFVLSDSNRPSIISLTVMSVGPTNNPKNAKNPKKMRRIQYVVQCFKLSC